MIKILRDVWLFIGALPGWLYPIVFLLAWVGVERWRVVEWRNDARQAIVERDAAKAMHEQDKQAWNIERKTALARSRARDHELRALDEEAEAKRKADDAKNKRLARELALARGSLRDAVGAFVRGPGASDTVARCRSEAIATGALLGEALQTSEACAIDGESQSGLARRLLESRQ